MVTNVICLRFCSHCCLHKLALLLCFLQFWHCPNFGLHNGRLYMQTCLFGLHDVLVWHPT